MKQLRDGWEGDICATREVRAPDSCSCATWKVGAPDSWPGAAVQHLQLERLTAGQGQPRSKWIKGDRQLTKSNCAAVVLHTRKVGAPDSWPGAAVLHVE